MKNLKTQKITEITYNNNTQSNYTEKIKALEGVFNYEQNKNFLWSKPELSLLYGTPLYQQASESQKIALNHLYWSIQYNQTAATEANAILYNQITGGVLAKVGGYEILCQELDLETAQERKHIHAFHTISFKTKKALMGKINVAGSTEFSVKKSKNINWQNEKYAFWLEKSCRLLNNQVVMRNNSNFYSQYLQELDEKGESIPAQTTGLLGQLAPLPVLKMFSLNCGSSPFLACLFFLTRYIANMQLKIFELNYFQYFKELEKKDEFIPVPTAVSHYHLLDEAFHTTISQLIGQELYKEFPKPNAYETLVANIILRRVQELAFSGLSGGLPTVFRSDSSFIHPLYKILRSPVFDFSPTEALNWLNRCLCEENDGFHSNQKYHQRMFSDLQRSFEHVDYLWPINRELKIMSTGGNITKAITKNQQVFKQFTSFIDKAA